MVEVVMVVVLCKRSDSACNEARARSSHLRTCRHGTERNLCKMAATLHYHGACKVLAGMLANESSHAKSARMIWHHDPAVQALLQPRLTAHAGHQPQRKATLLFRVAWSPNAAGTT
eukprot:1158508-Pelagomonas_calceolata.AAC.27